MTDIAEKLRANRHSFATTLLSSDIEAAADEIECLRETFRHTHMAGEGDRCATCGLDIRNPVHRRVNDPHIPLSALLASCRNGRPRLGRLTTEAPEQK